MHNKIKRIYVGLVAAVLMSSNAWAGSPAEHWQAISTTSLAITGDITFSPTRITFANGKTLPIAVVQKLPAFMDGDDKVSATLYRVTTPADPVLNAGNRLCGGRTAEPVTFIVTWQPEAMGADIAPRSLAVASGDTVPHSNRDSNVCGTYNYEAASAR